MKKFGIKEELDNMVKVTNNVNNNSNLNKENEIALFMSTMKNDIITALSACKVADFNLPPLLNRTCCTPIELQEMKNEMCKNGDKQLGKMLLKMCSTDKIPVGNSQLYRIFKLPRNKLFVQQNI